MNQERSSTLSAAGLVGPATLYVAVGLLIPLAILFRYSLNQFVPGKFMVDALTIENYVKFFTDTYYTAVLTRTVRIALITTIICLAMGFPLAYVLARTRTRAGAPIHWGSGIYQRIPSVLPLACWSRSDGVTEAPRSHEAGRGR